jgi:hypothetical protein
MKGFGDETGNWSLLVLLVFLLLKVEPNAVHGLGVSLRGNWKHRGNWFHGVDWILRHGWLRSKKSALLYIDCITLHWELFSGLSINYTKNVCLSLQRILR